MIEFYGEISYECKIDSLKRRAKNNGLMFLIATIVIGIISITVGIFRDVWIYSLILTTFFVIVTVVAFIPSYRFLNCEIPVQLIIENGMISYTALGGKKPLVTKPISKVKKVIDMGDWYYLIFRFGDISNSWVCQKNLIVQGTIEDFEKTFKNKIERNK